MNRFVIVLFILLVTSCANPVAPTGGPKDQKPPIIINTSIDSIQNQITIQYNENIRFQNKIILIPQKKDETIEVQHHDKKITIQLRDYTEHINLGQSIKDLNENNQGQYPFIHLNNDTLIQTKYISHPPFVKADIIAQSLRDSFIYNHQVNNDTIVQCCHNNIGNHITVTLDENKNKITDSFEWSITSSDTILSLYEPKRPKIQISGIDSHRLIITGTDVFRVIPKIKGPYTRHKDTLILNNTNYSILEEKYYINRNTQITDINSTIYRYQDSVVKTTTLLKNINIPKQDTTTYDTLKVGLISIKNNHDKPITIGIFEKDRKIYQNSISAFDSTYYYLPPGPYYYITYHDIDNNYILSQPDRIITYFKEIAIIKDIENHINLVKTPKNTEITPNKSSLNIQNNHDIRIQKTKLE